MLAEELLKMTTKGLFNLGRLGASKAIKSNTAKRKLKSMTNKYLDQALDSVTSDLSKKLDPFHKGGGNNNNYNNCNCTNWTLPLGLFRTNFTMFPQAIG